MLFFRHPTRLALSLSAALSLSFSYPVLADTKVVQLYNWASYLSTDTIKRFEAKTGYKIEYNSFDSWETAEAKLLAGHSGFDVVNVGTGFFKRQIDAGVYAPLNKSKLPNWKNLDPTLMTGIAQEDVGNKYGMPFTWWSTGIGYNVDLVAKRLGSSAPVESWKLLFDPAVVSKLKDCGVSILDSPGDVLPSALLYLGLDPNSNTPADYDKAYTVLMAARPYITKIGGEYWSDLANGETCATQAWSGDIISMMKSTAKGININYSIPIEGSVVGYDAMAIPSDAPNPEGAHALINHLLDPVEAAEFTNGYGYPGINANAAQYLSDDYKKGQQFNLAYPSAEMRKRIKEYVQPNIKTTRLITRLWTKIKTGV